MLYNLKPLDAANPKYRCCRLHIATSTVALSYMLVVVVFVTTARWLLALARLSYVGDRAWTTEEWLIFVRGLICLVDVVLALAMAVAISIAVCKCIPALFALPLSLIRVWLVEQLLSIAGIIVAFTFYDDEVFAITELTPDQRHTMHSLYGAEMIVLGVYVLGLVLSMIALLGYAWVVGRCEHYIVDKANLSTSAVSHTEYALVDHPPAAREDGNP